MCMIYITHIICLWEDFPFWLWGSMLPMLWTAYREPWDKKLRTTASKKLKPSIWQSTRYWILPTIEWAWKQILPQLSLQMRTLPWVALWFQLYRRPTQVVPGLLIHRISEIINVHVLSLQVCGSIFIYQ